MSSVRDKALEALEEYCSKNVEKAVGYALLDIAQAVREGAELEAGAIREAARLNAKMEGYTEGFIDEVLGRR